MAGWGGGGCAVGGWQPGNWRGRAQEHIEEVQELLVFAERGSGGMKYLILESFQDCLLPAPFSSSPTPIVVHILLLWPSGAGSRMSLLLL